MCGARSEPSNRATFTDPFMEIRNIHFEAPAEEPAPAPTMQAVVAALPERMRLRKVAVSPLEEYARREGNVRPISNALAACIQAIKGRVEINTAGARIDRKELGGVRVYYHVDSKICSDLGSREKKWFYVLNRHQPDRIHVLDDEGRYVETLPEKFSPHALNIEEQAAAAADDKRAFRRAADHLQRIHGPDTYQALQELRHNSEVSARYVQTMDAPASVERLPAAEPVEGGTADRINRSDKAHKQAVARRASAVELGHAPATVAASAARCS